MAINARDDFPTLARITDKGELPGRPMLVQVSQKALDEIDRLRRWKEEACEVLTHWDAVVDRFDLSAHLGEFSADAVGIEIDRLREKLI